jgi:O-antigen/teichoic acid export membrane protein
MVLKNFVERVASVLGRDVLVSIISFMVTTFLANSLGPAVFGLWIGIITLLMVFDLLFRLKIDQLIVLYSKEYPCNSGIYKRIALLSLYGILIGGLIALVFNAYIIEFFSLDGIWLLGLIFANFSLSVFGNITFYIFLAEEKYSAYNFSILSQSLTTGVLIFTLFYLFESSIYLALLSQLASWAVVLLFYVLHRFTMKKTDETIIVEANKVSSRDILVKGGYIYTSSAVKAMGDQLPRLFAISFLGSVFVGYLGLAQIIIGLINRVPLAINTVLYPMLVKESADELTKSLAIIRVMLVLFLPIVVLLEIFIPFLIDIFYGDNFVTVALYVRILLPFVYFGLPGIILGSYFSSQGKFNILFIINLVVALVSCLILGTMTLISMEYAPIAALSATFITITVSTMGYIYKSSPISEVLPTKEDVLIILRFVGVFWRRWKV